MALSIPGIGYQQESIQSPIPNADAGMINARADVQGAGAGMQRVAQAGAELERIADKITRQEDQTAVLQAKNASAIDINKALIDFQGKMTGNIAQDQAEWDAVASKIGQDHIAKLGNPVREQAFAKDFDTLHKASVIQVQSLSAKNQMEQLKTASAGQLANLIKGAMAVVQAGPADYVAQVDAQFKAYEDIVNAAPLLSQADKDANIQAAKQHFYLEVAKYQAEVTPGAFSRDWRDGVWTKHLTPEAVVGLQKFAQTAETTNAVRALQAKYPANPAAAVREAMSADYGAAHGYTVEQQNRVAAYFEGISNFNYQQQQRGREQAARSGISALAEAYLAGTPEAFEKIAGNPNADPYIREKAAKAYQTLQNKGNIPLYVDTANKASSGQITAEGIRDLIGPGGLTPAQANNAIKVMDSVSPSDKIAIAVRLRAFDGEVKDPEMRKQFATVFRRAIKEKKVTGDEAIMALGDELAKDTGWFSNNAPYIKAYQEMQSSGATTLRDQGRATPAPGPGQPIVIRYDSNGKRIQE